MELPDAIDRLRSSIVQIREGERVLGTGFLVGEDGYVITAGHVTKGVQQDNLGAGFALENTENFRANFMILRLDLIEEDPRHDLALLKLPHNPFVEGIPQIFKNVDSASLIPCSAATLDPERPREGTPIAVSGYPLGAPVLVTNAGHLATAWNTDIQQLPLPGGPAGLTFPDRADSYLADVQANPGNSGGPVYRITDGAVIGVCVAGQLTSVVDQNGNPVVLSSGHQLLHGADITVVIPTRYVVELLDRHGTSRL